MMSTHHILIGARVALYKMVPRALFPGVKQLGHESDHSPSSSAEVCGTTPLVPNRSRNDA
jgi:hypothetical protein